jgi:hypothetical protein
VRTSSSSTPGRQRLACTVARDECHQVAPRDGAVAVHLGSDVGNDIAQLRSVPAEPREPLGELAYGGGTLPPTDGRTLERAVLGEAAKHALDIALVERPRVTEEQVVDRDTILDVKRSYARTPSSARRWENMHRIEAPNPM